MRCAVIDIGSNTVRLVIFSIRSGSFTIIWNEKVNARLGHNLTKTGRLSPQGKTLAFSAFKRFRKIMDAEPIEHKYAVATAAVRRASDGATFAKTSEAILGLPIDILSGEAEARLSFLGTKSIIANLDGVVVDMGGRSLEAINSSTQNWASIDIGPLAPNPHEQDPDRWIKDCLKSDVFCTSSQTTLYLVGGSWRALAKVFQARTHYPIRIIHNYKINASDGLAQIEAIMSDLTEAPDAQNAALKRIAGARAEHVPHALRVLRALIQTTNCQKLHWSTGGIREGILVDKGLFETTDFDSELIKLTQNIALESGLRSALIDFIAPFFDNTVPNWAKAVIYALMKPQSFHQGRRTALTAHWALYASIFSFSHEDRACFSLALSAKPGNVGKALSMFQGFLDTHTLRQAHACGILAKLGLEVSGLRADILNMARLCHRDGTWTLNLTGAAEAMQNDFIGNALSALNQVCPPKSVNMSPKQLKVSSYSAHTSNEAGTAI